MLHQAEGGQDSTGEHMASRAPSQLAMPPKVWPPGHQAQGSGQRQADLTLTSPWAGMFSFSFLFYFFIFRAAPGAHGGSQARGPMGAVAASLRTPQPQQHQIRAKPATYTTAHSRILNPLSESKDQTCSLMDTGQVRFCCATMGMSLLPSFKTFF